MNEMPNLETKRLVIRPFVMEDLPDVHNLLDVQLTAEVLHTDKMDTLQERADWLQWTVLNYKQLAKLYQPPYGDRAITLRKTGELIGSCGYVPCLSPFEQLPGFNEGRDVGKIERYSTEFGLFYAISPSYQRRGYALEAAQAMVDYAFTQLRLRRIVATTDYDNVGSIRVMEKLGMRIERNPLADPLWLQVVGVLGNFT